MSTRRVLMVTGAARGIGAAVARLAARRGHDLLLTWRGSEAAAAATTAACREAGAAVELVQADAGSAAGNAAAFAALDRRFGRIDGFVANAGITGPSGPFLASTDAMWEEVMRVNLLGLASGCREAARRMAASRGGRGGAIVAISSRAASLGAPFEFVQYAASKAAVDATVIGLSKELAGEGIRVNAVAPGMIDTDIHAASGDPGRVERILPGVPMRRMGSAEEVAEAVLWLLSDASSYVTGAVMPVSGGR